MNTALSCSIDLDAELRSITERQHLNQVHYAVQLVRHALLHAPSEVRIEFTKEAFVLEHNGDSLSAREHQRVLDVVNAQEDSVRQEALSALEREHGVTLLSTLYCARQCRVEGANALFAERGRIRAAAPSARRGYRIELRSERPPGKKEEAELRFYCQHASVPITLNRQRLSGAPSIQGVLVSKRFRSTAGSGEVGLPRSGALKRTRLYKHGVYFGVRQSLPSDGLPLESFFNSTIRRHEENFSDSIQAATLAVRDARDGMLGELVELWPELKEPARQRLALMLSGLKRSAWPQAALAIPLFGTQRHPWTLSILDLEADAARRGFIPWVPPKTATERDGFLCLTEEQASRLQALFAVPLVRARPFARRHGWLHRTLHALRHRNERPHDANRPPADVIPQAHQPPRVQALLTALNTNGRAQFWLCDRSRREVQQAGTLTRVLLPAKAKEVAQLADRYAQDPRLLRVIATAWMRP